MVWQNHQVKIALISCGLGHVKRGIETWTDDLGQALQECGINVTVYKGAGKRDRPYEKVIPCLKRNDRLSRWLVKYMPGFCWRMGLGSGYQLEEATFTWSIFLELMRQQYDIIHTQDPHIADNIRKMRKLRLIRSKEILAHGTEEPFEFLGKFDYLQHLAPFHLEETRSHGYRGRRWFAIGNFIDTDVYHPNIGRSLRMELGIPDRAFVVLCVAAIKKGHKRIDYLIQEISRINHPDVVLVVAGSHGEQTEELMQLGQEKLGSRVVFLANFPHDRIQQVYAMADLFTLTSLKEMMPIALLEALACGLPAIVHQYPVEEWMIGEGGESIDMQKEGALAETIEKYYLHAHLRAVKAQKAREHAINHFSKEAVCQQIINMYEDVLQDGS
jgi:glycosyltransferase involved in cell wall biosynthesis